MRQRRHVLQVSTFPFLAVLLCTMGSLILLLLVIDRRARVVARAKAVHAVAALAAEDAAIQARRQAELERRQQALHAQLQAQDQDVVSQIQAADQKNTAARDDLRQEQRQTAELQQSLRDESDRLTQGQSEAQARQAEIAQTAARTQESQRDLTRLTGELTQLERTLADLKEVRKRDEHKYSLVPYRGRRGDNRRPLYVECADESVIFHPDRAALAGLQMTLGNIRTEVEQRIARKRAAAATAKEKDETPYLLLLVRPNGIRTYYKILSALEGLKIDFGYEFVEADWVLDFPEKEDAVVQPWMQADQTPAVRPTTPRVAAPKAPARLAAGNAPPVLGEAVGGGGNSNTPSLGLRSIDSGSPGIGFQGPAQPGGGAPAGVRLGGPGASGLFSVPGVAGTPTPGGTGIGLGIPGGVRAGSPGMTTPDGVGRIANPSGRSDGLAIRPTGQGGDGSGSRSTDRLQPSEPAGLGIAGTGVTARPGSGAMIPGNPALIEGPSPSPSGSSGNPGPNPSNPGQTLAGTGAASAIAPQAGPLEAPGTGSTGSGARGAISGSTDSPVGSNSPPTPSASSTSHTLVGGGTGNGEPRSEEPAAEGRPVLPPVLPDRSPPTRSAPVERPRVFGNRDWVVSVDCTAAGVMVLPSGQRIAATVLTSATPSDNPLLKVVQTLITRRQVMVRPGEPPYRPVVRFLVHPDGLRTYYLAYPALESLPVAMIRENVRPQKPDGH